MRYRVAFTKRVRSDGTDSSMKPSVELDQNLADGIVAEKVFVETLETDAQHSQEELDEDDAFLGSAEPEVWEYEIVDARRDEFQEAIQNSDLVLEYEVIDETETTADEAAPGLLRSDGVYPLDGEPNGEISGLEDATVAGSGRRAGDDGPAGRPTGDPSAGGLGSGPVPNDAEELAIAGSGGGLDDLNIENAGDPRLGLTNRGKKPPQDWAANTGPAQTPQRGIQSEGQRDQGSTLRPARKGRAKRG
jgi:hypothetical protein